MFSWNFTAWRVDDEMDVTVLDPVEDIWTSLMNLENLCHFDFCFSERFCRATGRNDFKTQFEKFARDGNDGLLIGVFYAHKHSSAFG